MRKYILMYHFFCVSKWKDNKGNEISAIRTMVEWIFVKIWKKSSVDLLGSATFCRRGRFDWQRMHHVTVYKWMSAVFDWRSFGSLKKANTKFDFQSPSDRHNFRNYPNMVRVCKGTHTCLSLSQTIGDKNGVWNHFSLSNSMPSLCINFSIPQFRFFVVSTIMASVMAFAPSAMRSSRYVVPVSQWMLQPKFYSIISSLQCIDLLFVWVSPKNFLDPLLHSVFSIL